MTVEINRLVKRRISHLMVTAIIVISMATLLMNVDLNQAVYKIEEVLMDISSHEISLDTNLKNASSIQMYQDNRSNRLLLIKGIISSKPLVSPVVILVMLQKIVE